MTRRAEPSDFCKVAKRFSYLRQKRQRQGVSILSLSWISTQTSCQHAVDKIFSIRDILATAESQHIGIDYGKDVSEVFAEATYIAIVSSGSFQILALIRPSPSRVNERGILPIWAVDFTFGGSEKEQRQSNETSLST